MNITIKLNGEIEAWAKNAKDGDIIFLGNASIIYVHGEFIMLEYDLHTEYGLRETKE